MSAKHAQNTSKGRKNAGNVDARSESRQESNGRNAH